MKIENAKDISKLIQMMLYDSKYSYYAFFVMGLIKKFQESGTAAVTFEGINPILFFNPKFLNSLETIDHKKFIMAHEVMHLASYHPFTLANLGNKERANIAADLFINSTLGNDLAPEGAVLSRDFGYKDRLSTREYYALLGKTEKDPNAEGHDLLKDLIQAGKDGKGIPTNHDWSIDGEPTSELSESMKEVLSSAIEGIAKNAAEMTIKSQGNIPGHIKDWLDSLKVIAPPVINYAQLVKRFADGSIDRYKKLSKKRLNKRFPDSFPGRKTKYKPTCIIYVDGSGSVSANKEYPLFFSQISHLSKEINFDIAHFDTKVDEPFKFNGEPSLPKSNGGTMFTPVAEHFNENPDYSFGIIMTDGEAEMPPKFKRPMLWMLTQDININNYPGTKIYL